MHPCITNKHLSRELVRGKNSLAHNENSPAAPVEIHCDAAAPSSFTPSAGEGSTMHHTKSYRSFEHLCNENCKLRNERKLMQHLREVWLKIPWRNPLSAEMSDASTWRIGLPLLSLLMTDIYNDSLCYTKRNKNSSRCCLIVMMCSCCIV